MNVDHILTTFQSYQVQFLLIGGMHFLLRHSPILTYDIGLWIEDSAANRAATGLALAAHSAEWGRTDADWGPVASKAGDWLGSQSVFCLNSPHGAIDVFRAVLGLGSWSIARQNAVSGQTASGIPYFGISDEDMSTCPGSSISKGRSHYLRCGRSWVVLHD